MSRFEISHLLTFTTALFLAVFITACEQHKAPPELTGKHATASSSGNTADGAAGAENIFIRVAEEVTPSVVNISTYQPVDDSEGQTQDEQFRTGQPQRPEKSMGSGVIVSADGYIITNAHVVMDATEITVKLSDKREFTGELVGADAKTDIAVIKITTDEQLQPAKLGDSSKLKIGQWAIAIGNPFGLDRTVTVGVVSGIGREDVGVAQYENFIQTDASINPGNSGGPLLNSAGEVIGINTAIMSSGQGISFAIPIDMVKDISTKLIENGEVIRGWLGVGIQTLTPELAAGLGVSSKEGVLVNRIYEGSPAHKARVKVGDVLTEFGGYKINEVHQLQSTVAATEVGKVVAIKLVRDGKVISLKVKITEMGEMKEAEQTRKAELESSTKLGLTVHPVSEAIGVEGVVVVEVDAGSNSEKAGISVGDLIKTINRTSIRGLKDFKAADNTLRNGDTAVLLVMRAKNPLFIAVRVEE